MFITGLRIQQLAPRAYPSVAVSLAAALEEQMPKYGVTTLLRRAHFMGQACYESLYFSRFEEDLHYSAERIPEVFPHLKDLAVELAGNPQRLANAAYADRNGNGDEASGDGWKFRGRGAFQLTGRANYAAAGTALGIDLIDNPDQVSSPDGAMKTALWFWGERHCNAQADLNSFSGVTRAINGPKELGLDIRTKLTEEAMRIFA